MAGVGSEFGSFVQTRKQSDATASASAASASDDTMIEEDLMAQHQASIKKLVADHNLALKRIGATATAAATDTTPAAAAAGNSEWWWSGGFDAFADRKQSTHARRSRNSSGCCRGGDRG